MANSWDGVAAVIPGTNSWDGVAAVIPGTDR